MVVPGPGLLNAMAGLATAYACNSRVLAIVGNIHSPAIGKGYGLLHEVRNQSAILGCVTKWQAPAGKPAEVPTPVPAAVQEPHTRQAQPLRPGNAARLPSADARSTPLSPPPLRRWPPPPR